MARLHLTEAEARQLGITPKTTRTKTRRRALGPYHTRCSCGVEFTVVAEEDRHVKETGHARYQLIMEFE